MKSQSQGRIRPRGNRRMHLVYCSRNEYLDISFLHSFVSSKFKEKVKDKEREESCSNMQESRQNILLVRTAVRQPTDCSNNGPGTANPIAAVSADSSSVSGTNKVTAAIYITRNTDSQRLSDSNGFIRRSFSKKRAKAY